LRDGAQSGGVILDMHIHDVDAALWWFGKPATVTASGLMQGDLPVAIDALWHYANGPVVALHSAWDDHSGGFAYGFTVVLEAATIVHNSALDQFQLLTGGREGTHVKELKRDTVSAYQHEIDYMIAHLQSGETVTRVTPQGSRQAVEVVLQELRQIAPANPACAL
jgi:predicted dehydrogenase